MVKKGKSKMAARKNFLRDGASQARKQQRGAGGQTKGRKRRQA